MILEDFAWRLVNAMDYKDYTQKGLAEEIGVDKKRVYDWVHGNCLPDLWNFKALVLALGVSPEYLLFGGKMR